MVRPTTTYAFFLAEVCIPYGYIGAEAGYRFRSEDPSDEYRYLLEYGISAGDNLYFRTKLDGTESAGNGKQQSGGADSNLSVDK